MLKYVETKEVFAEIPDEISLAISISNCPIHCTGCHSQYLWDDIGTPLDEETLKRIIDAHNGITCVLFSGGDNDVCAIERLSEYVKSIYPDLKVAWYSGREDFVKISYKCIDYIKLGPYNRKLGSLQNPSTNQRLYRIEHEEEVIDGKAHTVCRYIDITNLFWEKNV